MDGVIKNMWKNSRFRHPKGTIHIFSLTLLLCSDLRVARGNVLQNRLESFLTCNVKKCTAVRSLDNKQS